MAKSNRRHIKKTSSKRIKGFFDRKFFSIFSGKTSDNKKRHIPGLRPFLVAITAAGLIWGGAVALDKTKIGADAQVFVAQETNKTAYSKYVDEQNSYWENANPEHKIILLDSDYIDSAVALSSYLGFPKTRQQAMYDYAAKRGIKMNPYYLHYLEQALMLQRNPSARVESYENYMLLQSGEKEACIIAPAWTEMNVKELGGKWVGGAPAAAFGFKDLDGKELKMSVEEFRKFIDNHEIGHCMDNVTMPNMKFGNGIESSWMRHKAESFADAHAALTSARLGFHKTYRKIADLRATASKFQGPYIAKMANGGFSSGVYSTAPTLEGVGRYLAENGAEGLKSMSKMEIADLAQKIMAENAMTLEEYKDLYQYHKIGPSFIKKLSDELEVKPENAKRIAFLNDYIKESNASFKRTVDMDLIKKMRKGKTIAGTLGALLNGLTAEQQEQVLWESLVERARAKGGLAQHFAEEIKLFRDDVRKRIANGDKVSLAERNMVARPGLHLTSTKKEYRVPKALRKFVEPSKQENLPDNNPANDGKMPKHKPMQEKPDEIHSFTALSNGNLANIKYLKTKAHKSPIKPPRI